MSKPQHVPVLFHEVLEFLNVRPGATVVDATLGLGGHSSGIARLLGGKGRLICFDRDPQAMELGKARLAELKEELGSAMPEVVFEPRAFSEAGAQLAEGSIDGLLADFGVSSLQLGEAQRGFSFQQEGPLDMRMDTRAGVTAEQVVNQADEEDLANLIYEFGEERRSRRIARALVRARPLQTTAELAGVVAAAAPTIKTPGGHSIHPATKTFQALRIHVNNELGEIESLLQSAPRLLRAGGRVALISFHSLEDRLVKDSLRELAQRGVYNLLTRKPVTASEDEEQRNPRARSAKLRAAERTEEVFTEVVKQKFPRPVW